MATRPSITGERRSQFINALLAPIPSQFEQAGTPEFRKLIVRDMLMVWRHGMDDVRIAKAKHIAVALEGRRSDHQLSPQTYLLFNERLRAEEAQCLIPAPTAKELRWKKRLLKTITDKPDVAAAIAADEQRLARVA